MDVWLPEDDAPVDPGWWAPLMRFGLAMARADLPAIDPDDFMLMGRIDRKGRPRVWVYKHRLTRRHVNVADDGTPYAYIPPKSPNSRYEGRYVRHRCPKAAWWRLDLLSLEKDFDDLAEPQGLEECEDHEFEDFDVPSTSAA